MKNNILFVIIANLLCVYGYSQSKTIQITFEIDGERQNILNQSELLFISKADTFKSVIRQDVLEKLPFNDTKLVDIVIFKCKEYTIVFDSLALNLNSSNTFDKSTQWIFGVHNRGKQANKYIPIEWEKAPWKALARIFYWKIHRTNEEGYGIFEYENIK